MDKKPKYFQLEPTAFLSDIDFQMMTAQERGVYFTVILYLYANGGTIGDNIGTLQALCNYGRDMISWEQMWGNIKHKFQMNGDGLITHKRVSKEMNESKQRMQVAKKSGLRGAKKRWGAYNNPIADTDGVPIAKVSKGKVSKDKIRKETNNGVIPDNLSGPKFLQTWEDWIKYRIEIRHKLTPLSIGRQLKLLSEFSVSQAIEIIEKSIRNGWQGLFPNREDNNGRKNTTNQKQSSEKTATGHSSVNKRNFTTDSDIGETIEV